MNVLPFSMPAPGSVTSLSITTTTGRSIVDGTGGQVMFMNAGSTGCYVAVGDITVEATVNDIFIPGNTMRVFTVAGGTLYFAAITSTGTTTLLCASGSGA
jgi:2',3'-cyclic-nucleotide 2'-phosphodiesterase (5'-nucleotidase family)